MGSKVQVRPVFAWYDLWVGVFIDRPWRIGKRRWKRIYIFPVPCLGIVIEREEPT